MRRTLQRFHSRIWCLIAILGGVSYGQEPARESGVPAFLEDAHKYVIESTKDKAKLKLNEKSLLNWTNSVPTYWNCGVAA